MIHVKLSDQEVALAGLLAPTGADEKGAQLAWCKCFNLYPLIEPEGRVHAVGRTHTRIRIAHLADPTPPDIITGVPQMADIFGLVTGTMPDMFVHGFWPKKAWKEWVGVWGFHFKEIVPMESLWLFEELLNGTRDWETAYVKGEGTWEKAPPVMKLTES